MALLSSLESEHTGTLQEIDRRLREAKVLIEGYKIDPIARYIAVKLDFLRSIRPDDEVKELGQQGAKPLLERIFAGLPGYLVVTDSQIRIDEFGYKELGEDHVSIQTTMHIEHTFVMKDGKYVCEWGDPANPLHQPQTLCEKGPVTRQVEQRDGMHVIRYNL